MAKSDIDQLLEQLRNQGQLDSQGSFTLDLDSTHNKRIRYLVSDANVYVLKLVQWAVASKASRITIEINSDTLRFHHDGKPPEPKEIKTLSSFMDRPASPQSYLAWAHHMCSLLEPENVSLQVHYLYGTAQSDLGKQGTLTTTTDHLGAQTRTPSVLLVISGLKRTPEPPSSQWKALLQRAKDIWQPPKPAEIRYLDNFAAYAPIPILLNGKLLNRPYFGVYNRIEVDDNGFDLTPRHAARLFKANKIYLVHPRGQILAPSSHCGASSQWKLYRENSKQWLFVAELSGDELERLDLNRQKADGPYRFRVGKQGEDLLPSSNNTRMHGVPMVYCQAILARLPAGSGPGHMSFLQHGIIMKPPDWLQKDLPAGLTAVVDANDLLSDASLFGLVHNEAFERRFQTILEQASNN